MDLYLLRHGDAGPPGAWKGRDDERPLSVDGAEQMRREAAAMARLGIRADTILTSPLLRARQTAEIVADAMHARPEVRVEERLAPGFDAQRLERLLARNRETSTLMLVGHEPDFSRVIAACTGGTPVTVGKGTLARLVIDDPAFIKGTLAWLIPAAALAG